MNQIKNCLIVLMLTILLIGCSDTSNNVAPTNTDTTSRTTVENDSKMPAYDPAREPLTVEAAFANKLADTLNVKMYEVTLKPGDTVALHNHPDHSIYVLQGGKLSITVEGAEAQVLDLKEGMGMVTGAENHSGKNTGSTTIKLLLHDIYRPRGD